MSNHKQSNNQYSSDPTLCHTLIHDAIANYFNKNFPSQIRKSKRRLDKPNDRKRNKLQ